MSAPRRSTGIDRVQPTLFAMQVALAATMKAYGVRPGAVIGHSMGEAAAAVVAGALSLEDGVKVICRRSRLMATHRRLRCDGIGGIACRSRCFRSSPPAGSTTSWWPWWPRRSPPSIGGATETVRELVAAWEQRGVMAREVAVDVASHSPQVDPILDELADALAGHQPDGAEGSVLLGDPRTTRATSPSSTPTTGWTTCGTPCGSPRRCRPRSRTASGSSASWPRTRC